MANVSKESELFIAPNATVIGQVKLAKDCSVWFNAVLRADADVITIEERTNIQDGAIIHVDPGFPVHIGHDVIVGHAAIIHGASVGNHTLIGMRSTVLNGAKIGNWCIIGAHALVTEGMEIPDYSLVIGSPAKIVKTLTESQIAKVRKNAEVYVNLSKRYLAGEFEQ
jgi:carbonic anhydrase/acetyltransferase-like protein (isoleucine patch superfamily)